MIYCTVYRTHELGKALPNFRLGSGVTGRVMLKGINHEGLHRAIRVLEIRAVDAAHADKPSSPPCTNCR